MDGWEDSQQAYLESRIQETGDNIRRASQAAGGASGRPPLRPESPAVLTKGTVSELAEAGRPPLALSFNRQPGGGQEGGSRRKSGGGDSIPSVRSSPSSVSTWSASTPCKAGRIHPDRALDPQGSRLGARVWVLMEPWNVQAGSEVPTGPSCPANRNAQPGRVRHPQNRAGQSWEEPASRYSVG